MLAQLLSLPPCVRHKRVQTLWWSFWRKNRKIFRNKSQNKDKQQLIDVSFERTHLNFNNDANDDKNQDADSHRASFAMKIGVSTTYSNELISVKYEEEMSQNERKKDI